MTRDYWIPLGAVPDDPQYRLVLRALPWTPLIDLWLTDAFCQSDMNDHLNEKLRGINNVNGFKMPNETQSSSKLCVMSTVTSVFNAGNNVSMETIDCSVSQELTNARTDS